ncbi:MAG TPA: DUF3300 domain-containing protein [Burkholderiales bacterium]
MNWKALLLVVAPLCFHQPTAGAETGYPPARMEALVAPIALYPDPLIFSILAAAAYPDEVVEASRSAQPDDLRWHSSVRTLKAFPELLERMAENPQWMRDLAYAQRTQPADLDQAVQSLRQEAYAAGRLASSPEQQVALQGNLISIQPALPQVFYVPYYDPLIVYGRWRPAYPLVQWRPWAARRSVVSHEHRRREEPNGPPSPAQRMQPQVSPAQQMQPQVSPAQQMQQQIQRDRDQQLERQRTFGR